MILYNPGCLADPPWDYDLRYGEEWGGHACWVYLSGMKSGLRRSFRR